VARARGHTTRIAHVLTYHFPVAGIGCYPALRHISLSSGWYAPVLPYRFTPGRTQRTADVAALHRHSRTSTHWVPLSCAGDDATPAIPLPSPRITVWRFYRSRYRFRSILRLRARARLPARICWHSQRLTPNTGSPVWDCILTTTRSRLFVTSPYAAVVLPALTGHLRRDIWHDRLNERIAHHDRRACF